MNATELMIGNYVNYQGRAQKICALNMNSLKIGELAYDYHRETLSNILIKPIPLTEDWLLKFGFKFRKCGISGADSWQGLDFWSKECDMDYLTLRGSVKYGLRIQGFINSEIKHVHQLQNLYFALTQKELNIN